MNQGFFDLLPDERKQYVNRLLENHEELIPVILRFGPECSFSHRISNTKLLISKHQRIIAFLANFRKQHKLVADSSISLSYDDLLLKTTMSFEELYHRYRSEDMILYLKMHEMAPFGLLSSPLL
jgi:hypothetical protein